MAPLSAEELSDYGGDETPLTCFSTIDEQIQRMSPLERANASQFLDTFSLLTLQGLGVENVMLADPAQYRLSGPIRTFQMSSDDRLKPYPIRSQGEAILRWSIMDSIRKNSSGRKKSEEQVVSSVEKISLNSKTKDEVKTKEDGTDILCAERKIKLSGDIMTKTGETDLLTTVTSSRDSSGSSKAELARLIQKFRRVLASFPYKEIECLGEVKSLKFTIGDRRLQDVLKEAVTAYTWCSVKDSILYVPGQVITPMRGGQHHLLFGAMTQLIPNSKYFIHSEFESLCGESREVFTRRKNGIVYLGTYRLHSLKHLAPKGCPVSPQLTLDSILSAALPLIRPNNFPGVDELRRMYLSGELHLECVALELVGVNLDIFEGLSRYQKARLPPKPRRDQK